MHKKNFRELSTLLSTFQPVIGDFSKHVEAEKKKGIAYKKKKVYSIKWGKGNTDQMMPLGYNFSHLAPLFGQRPH